MYSFIKNFLNIHLTKKNIQDLSAIILHHIMKPGELKSGLIFLVYLIAKYFFKY